MPESIIPGAEPESIDGGPHGALVLHGFTGNCNSMRGVAHALAAAGYAVELPLLPGHGTSVEDMNTTSWSDWSAAAEEALEKLCTGIEPQLRVILSDINMPVMDGLELLREIKTRRPDLPVMMVTAYGDDERRRLASQYGAAEFITKPVNFDLLKTQLRDLSDAAD